MIPMSDAIERLELEENRPLDEHRYVVRQRLGSGGAAVVYEVEQLGLGIPRAVKILDPMRPDYEDEFAKTFEQEVKHLSQLTHRNIIKILDYQTLELKGREYPFFVMEFVSGGELSHAIPQITSRDELLSVLDQIFDGLEYIHSRGMIHGDLKPTNILYHNTGNLEAKIEVKVADLGVSKFLRIAQETISTTPDKTLVWGTRNYAAPEIRDKINSGELVESEWLKENAGTIDLYSLGVTLAVVLSEDDLQGEADREKIAVLLENIKPNLVRCFSPDELKYLKRFIRKLTESDPQKRYREVKEARSALSRMTPKSVAFGTIPELTGVGCPHKISHGAIQTKFSKRTFRWLYHPVVQRLNHLNQLNFLYNVYPGARHSRFAHSLEVFETAREVTLHLLNDGAFRFLLDEADIALFLAASLLHDIGHYPLAHSLEDLRPTLVEDPMDLSVVRADWELFTYFLQSHFPDAPPPWDQPLWDMLVSDGIDPERMARLVSKGREPTDAESVMRTLLDGPLDIDKIAYLRHDSQTTSVPYGSGVDVAGLLSALVVLLPSEYSQVRQAQIGLKSRGISAAESVISARYHMYNRVYWHRTNRAIMAMLGYAFRRLIGGEEPFITFEQYIEETRSLSDWGAIRWLSDYMQNAIDLDRIVTESGRPITNILPGIVDGTRRLHKRLLSFASNDAEKDLGECHSFLQSLNPDEVERIRIDLLELISKRVNYEDVGDEEVLIDIPRKRKDRQALPSQLWVLDEQTKNLHRFPTYSQIAKATSVQYQSIANRIRIFVSPRLEAGCAQIRSALQHEIIALISERSRGM